MSVIPKKRLFDGQSLISVNVRSFFSLFANVVGSLLFKISLTKCPTWFGVLRLAEPFHLLLKSRSRGFLFLHFDAIASFVFGNFRTGIIL